MKSIFRLMLVPIAASLLTGGVVVAQRHYLPTGRDAFNHFQVDSVDELVEAIQDNPTLLKRYAKHFRVSESEVISYVKSVLVPSTLKKDTVFDVRGVTRTGKIYSVRTKLRKGTRIWATRSGVPVLKWACGNPLLARLPREMLVVPQPKVARVSRKPATRVASLPTVADNLAGEQEEMVADVAAPAVGEFSGEESIPGSGGSIPVPTRGGRGGFPVGFLAAVPFLFSGNGGTTEEFGSTAIPEPGTMALSLVGLTALPLASALRGRRRSR